MKEYDYIMQQGSGGPSNTEQVQEPHQAENDTQEIKEMLRLLLEAQGIEYNKEVAE